MKRSAAQLRRDALAIWQAGVDAVRADHLIRQAVRVDGDTLLLGDEAIQLDEIDTIAVVGAGKACALMAAAVEEAFGPDLFAEKNVTGWVNVAADTLRPLAQIHLHPARPPGKNEPTPEAAHGTEEILRIVGRLGPRDLCIVLIGGGGSALLPAPVEGITLADKVALTRHLSAAGANIRELNTVRKQLSRVKGGGLARACRAGRLVSLIISDVLGDPLDFVASGPTVEDTSTPAEALAVLETFAARAAGISASVFETLSCKAAETDSSGAATRPETGMCQVTNVVIGNNAVAVDAAGMKAESLGYSHAMHAATTLEGAAEEVGRALAEQAIRMQQAGPDCLITGGEPTVTLVEESRRGLGGRNMQLVLTAAKILTNDNTNTNHRSPMTGYCLLSGGTDGEDGPTDAAGAWLDGELLTLAEKQGLDTGDYLARNDAYHFFEPLGSLIKTGPTHTNVCDLRVVVVDRIETP